MGSFGSDKTSLDHTRSSTQLRWDAHASYDDLKFASAWLIYLIMFLWCALLSVLLLEMMFHCSIVIIYCPLPCSQRYTATIDDMECNAWQFRWQPPRCMWATCGHYRYYVSCTLMPRISSYYSILLYNNSYNNNKYVQSKWKRWFLGRRSGCRWLRWLDSNKILYYIKKCNDCFLFPSTFYIKYLALNYL